MVRLPGKGRVVSITPILNPRLGYEEGSTCVSFSPQKGKMFSLFKFLSLWTSHIEVPVTEPLVFLDPSLGLRRWFFDTLEPHLKGGKDSGNKIYVYSYYYDGRNLIHSRFIILGTFCTSCPTPSPRVLVLKTKQVVRVSLSAFGVGGGPTGSFCFYYVLQREEDVVEMEVERGREELPRFRSVPPGLLW